MKLTNEDVQEILQLLDASSFDVLHLQTERFTLTLRRNGQGPWSQETQVLAAPNLLQASPSASVAVPSVAAKPGENLTEGLKEVRASLLGTFYRAPKPGAPPFVEVGSRVEKDTVIGIIETMKLMNAVYAGAGGEVVEICHEDAQFAEQGAVLMRIKPEGT
jgi:acetyl-CoA carboxylase biotin carboxyl carrier protein